jgi:hypothetical protein
METCWDIDFEKGLIKIVPNMAFRRYTKWAFIKWLTPEKYNEPLVLKVEKALGGDTK